MTHCHWKWLKIGRREENVKRKKPMITWKAHEIFYVHKSLKWIAIDVRRSTRLFIFGLNSVMFGTVFNGNVWVNGSICAINIFLWKFVKYPLHLMCTWAMSTYLWVNRPNFHEGMDKICYLKPFSRADSIAMALCHLRLHHFHIKN